MTIPRNLSNLAPGASVSGVLDVAHGGTGSSTTFTVGSVVFAGASGVYSQDNAQFFWDDTNNRLGIGTATPGDTVSIAASTPTISLSTPTDGNRAVNTYYNEGTLLWTTGINYSGGDGIFFIQRNGGLGNLSLVPDGNGSVGIGRSVPTAALDVNGLVRLLGGNEVATVTATAATGTINFDVSTQSVLYYTSNASGNFTINVRASSGATLNSIMAIGDAITIAFLNTNGGTAYYNSAVTIDGSANTPKWQGGTAPTSGNASSVDIYVYTVVKTANATFTVYASQTKFA